jgi:hypothetical protein
LSILEKNRIRDKHSGSVTLQNTVFLNWLII